MFKLDTGIPMPEERNGLRSEIFETAKKMRVEHSFFIPMKRFEYLRGTPHTAVPYDRAVRNGFQIHAKQWVQDNGSKGYRFWKEILVEQKPVKKAKSRRK